MRCKKRATESFVEKRATESLVDYDRLRAAIPPAANLRELVAECSGLHVTQAWLALLDDAVCHVTQYVTSTRHELETRLSWISSIDTAGTASLDKAEKAAIGLGDALVALGRYAHVNRQALFKVAEEFDSVHGALAAPRLRRLSPAARQAPALSLLVA